MLEYLTPKLLYTLLDVLVITSKDKLEFNAYQKSRNMNVYISFYSHNNNETKTYIILF